MLLINHARKRGVVYHIYIKIHAMSVCLSVLSVLFLTPFPWTNLRAKYRVSQSELTKVNWVWQIKMYNSNFVWKWFWNPEIGGFLELQPLLMKYLLSALYWTRFKSPSFSIWFSTIFVLIMATFSFDCKPIWLNTC